MLNKQKFKVDKRKNLIVLLHSQMGNILCRDKTPRPRRVYVKGPATDFNPQLFATDSIGNGTRKDHHNGSNKM